MKMILLIVTLVSLKQVSSKFDDLDIDVKRAHYQSHLANTHLLPEIYAGNYNNLHRTANKILNFIDDGMNAFRKRKEIAIGSLDKKIRVDEKNIPGPITKNEVMFTGNKNKNTLHLEKELVRKAEVPRRPTSDIIHKEVALGKGFQKQGVYRNTVEKPMSSRAPEYNARPGVSFLKQGTGKLPVVKQKGNVVKTDNLLSNYKRTQDDFVRNVEKHHNHAYYPQPHSPVEPRISDRGIKYTPLPPKFKDKYSPLNYEEEIEIALQELEKEAAFDRQRLKIMDKQDTLLPNWDKGLPAIQHEKDDTSVADGLARKVRVLCWVLTYPANHNITLTAIKNTWGKRCTKLLFMSTQAADPSVPTVSLNVKEGRDHLWPKVKAAYRHIYRHYRHKYHWFLKADDDTFIIMENLRFMLAGYQPSDPLYFGCRFKKYNPQGYMSGGAGVVLSRNALVRLVQGLSAGCQLPAPADDATEDVNLGRCLAKVGVKAIDTRDSLHKGRFLPFTPQDVLSYSGVPFWYWSYVYYPTRKGMECCSDYTISFHYVSPPDMYALEFLIYRLRPYGIKFGAAQMPKQVSSPKYNEAQSTPPITSKPEITTTTNDMQLSKEINAFFTRTEQARLLEYSVESATNLYDERSTATVLQDLRVTTTDTDEDLKNRKGDNTLAESINNEFLGDRVFYVKPTRLNDDEEPTTKNNPVGISTGPYFSNRFQSNMATDQNDFNDNPESIKTNALNKILNRPEYDTKPTPTRYSYYKPVYVTVTMSSETKSTNLKDFINEFYQQKNALQSNSNNASNKTRNNMTETNLLRIEYKTSNATSAPRYIVPVENLYIDIEKNNISQSNEQSNKKYQTDEPDNVDQYTTDNTRHYTTNKYEPENTKQQETDNMTTTESSKQNIGTSKPYSKWYMESDQYMRKYSPKNNNFDFNNIVEVDFDDNLDVDPERSKRSKRRGQRARRY